MTGKTLYYHQADDGDMNKTKKAMKQVEKRTWLREVEDELLEEKEDNE